MTIKNPMRARFVSLYRFEVLVCLLLITVTAAVYWPVHSYDFVNFDDDWYVSENPYVKKGLNLETFLWAFSAENKDGAHWHPVTWLSHLLDYQLFGMHAGRHHVVSLGIHMANAVLLFLLFRWTTGGISKSALLALLFALHPVNVDSVVWIAERKNVLSTFFWLLTMLAYVHYSKHPRTKRYLAVFFLFCLGIMSKQMLVTLPCVLLLMDFWPLGRYQRTDLKGKVHLAVEKAPLFALSLFLVLMSSLARPDMLSLPESVSMGLRIQNAIVSYVAYMGKLIYPIDLIVYYPFPQSIPMVRVAAAFLLLALVSLVVWMRRSHRYLVVGWLWYLGTLFPVIGLVQVGLWPALADRWAYIPFIGLFIMLVWGGEALLRSCRYAKPIWLVSSAVVIAMFVVLTPRQVRHWENSISLFTHATRIAPHPISLYNLGNALLTEGRYEEALKAYEAVLKIDPLHARAHNNIGNALLNLGRLKEADAHLAESFRLNPRDPSLLTNKGLLLFVQKRFNEAVYYFIRSLAMEPGHFKTVYYLGLAMLQTGSIDRGIQFLEKAKAISPHDAHVLKDLAEAKALETELNRNIEAKKKSIARQPQDPLGYCELGNLYRDAGRFKQAATAYRSAIQLNSEYTDALQGLGVAYAAQGRYREAVSALKSASKSAPDNPDIDYMIASVYARTNQSQESIDWLRKAIDKGYNQWETMAQDVNLSSLRQDPGFQSLMKGKGLEQP